MKPTEIIGNCHLFLGDCREILPHLPKVDLVLTDPPYGIGESWGGKTSWQKGCGKARMWGDKPDWDVVPEKWFFDYAITNKSILWGANYFEGLPAEKGWLIWNKCADMTQAQAELAWSNCVANARVFDKSPLGVFGNGGANGELKEHPTQKPIALMEWCINLAPKNTLTVADPFAGSGTTGVACVRMGKKFYGIERERKYFDIMCERIRREVDRPQLFPFSYGTTDKDKQGFQSDSQLQLIQTGGKD